MAGTLSSLAFEQRGGASQRLAEIVRPHLPGLRILARLDSQHNPPIAQRRVAEARPIQPQLGDLLRAHNEDASTGH